MTNGYILAKSLWWSGLECLLFISLQQGCWALQMLLTALKHYHLSLYENLWS